MQIECGTIVSYRNRERIGEGREELDWMACQYWEPNCWITPSASELCSAKALKDKGPQAMGKYVDEAPCESDAPVLGVPALVDDARAC